MESSLCHSPSKLNGRFKSFMEEILCFIFIVDQDQNGNCVVHVFYKSQLSKVYCFHGVMKL